MVVRLFTPVAARLAVARLAAAALATVLASLPAAAQTVPACEAAGTAAEDRYAIPAGLLNAIGRVESGRRDPGTGRTAAWPWAINAEGRGRLFESRDEALAGTRALQAGGVSSIDVGCFQVNLLHHRGAFATLEDGFDPARNADYAARFLVGLREKLGNWDTAVAHYHSALPERGGPYRDRVFATWTGGGAVPPTLAAPSAALALAPVPAVRSVSWSAPVGGGMRVWTPSAPGQGASVIRLAAARP